MAVVGSGHPEPARPRPQACRQRPRAGRRDGGEQRARRLHEAQRRREHLGRARCRHHCEQPERQGAAVRSGVEQGLPASDVLPDAGRSEEPLACRTFARGERIAKNMADPEYEYLLRLGDSALVLAQRLAEWCGKAPVLEEDIALANTSLDLRGQARLWLALAGEREGAGRDEDDLAFLRDAHEFRNLLLVEQPNGHYGDTLVRQFLFDAWHKPLLEALAHSTDRGIADIAAKAAKEVAYHLHRSADLVVRLGDGTAESHRRMQSAVDKLWMYTGELFEADATDVVLIEQGVAADPRALRERWLDEVGAVLAKSTLAMPPPDAWMQRGGRQGRHTEHLGYLLAEMQFLQRAYPGAQW